MANQVLKEMYYGQGSQENSTATLYDLGADAKNIYLAQTEEPNSDREPYTNLQDKVNAFNKSIRINGNSGNASGNNAAALGIGTTASGSGSLATGNGTTAEGTNSFAGGARVRATANCSHAEGMDSRATQPSSHAEGYATHADGDGSHSEGHETTASGVASHAEGKSSQATGEGAHAEGQSTLAEGQYSHAEGYGTIASGVYAHAEGYETQAVGNSHAEGYKTQATGVRSHAEGNGAVASGQVSHAEGWRTTASGAGSHAEGIATIAEGIYSHAEGGDGQSKGDYSHVEGLGSCAYGVGSHAEGQKTTAYGAYSHTEGIGETIGPSPQSAGYSYDELFSLSTRSGKFNIAYGDYSHSEGNNCWAYGIAAHSEGGGNHAIGDYSHSEGSGNIAYGVGSHAEGAQNIILKDINYSHVEGADNRVNGHTSHVEGQGNLFNEKKQWIVSSSKIKLNPNAAQNVNTGEKGFYLILPYFVDQITLASAAGLGCLMIEDAEGNTYTTYNEMQEYLKKIGSFLPHSNDYQVMVQYMSYIQPALKDFGRYNLHSIGGPAMTGFNPAVVLVDFSNLTELYLGVQEELGKYSVAHVEGFNNIVDDDYQHVQGKFNQPINNCAFVIGGGTSNTARKNIHTLDWDGNAEFAGNISFYHENQIQSLSALISNLQSQINTLKLS